MYCHPCQRSFSEDAIYCSQCGQKLSDSAEFSETSIEQTIAIFPSDETKLASEKHNHRIRHKKFFNFVFRSVIFITIIFIALSVFLIYTYSHQNKINETVLTLQTEAKARALEGNYEEAIKKLDEAIAIRPGFQSLKADQDIIYEAIKIERMAEDVKASLDKGIEVESEKKLDLFRQELNGLKEPIFNAHREQLETLNMKFTILSLTNELSQIFTIEELGNLLNVANGLAGEDASALREQIMDRIRTTTTAEVNELVKSRRYSAAISTINQSLTWLRNDKQLMDLRANVEKQRDDYDMAEQERIQRAMEQQAAEDYINQTAAVELVSFTKKLDELGQAVIIVSLKNVATRAIFDVKLEYSVLNENGDVLYKNKTTVSPESILSGESMMFNVTLPNNVDISMVHEVIINKGTWSLD